MFEPNQQPIRDKEAKYGFRFEPVLEVVVDESKWTGRSFEGETGRPGTGSALVVGPGYSNRGHLCCMGFMMEELGVEASYMEDVGIPTEFIDETIEADYEYDEIDCFRDQMYLIEDDLAEINDTQALSVEEKKRRIDEIGEEVGIKWIWENAPETEGSDEDE